jgi:hypothetical protein
MTTEEGMHEIWGVLCPDCGPENYEVIAREVGKLRDQVENAYVDVVFDGAPGPELPRFVEVENEQGKSIDFGKWMERSDGWWVLRIPVAGSALR